jgi:peptidoglycan/LPS O-acetylase OafA/YrhL
MKFGLLKNISFQRIISKGKFIPEIDGLRFIAISSVIFYHITAFIIDKTSLGYEEVSNNFFINIFLNGDYGVPLFFVISGFILGIPFAKSHFFKHTKINLKEFYLRRLTRLEPPYILVMTILFFGSVYVANNLSFQDATLSYLASLIYSHNIIYSFSPLLNAVAWSLEIEIQFYILTPIITSIFLISSVYLRRIITVLLILFFLIINHFDLIDYEFVSLINYIQYFLLGYLLSDLYLTKSFFIPKTKIDTILCGFFLIIIWVYNENDFSLNYHKFLWELFQLISIFFIFYYILFKKVFKLFSSAIITNLGGMCYSIYLLHYPIISLFGNKLIDVNFSNNFVLNYSIISLILLVIIIIISTIFFVLVERPCMDKNWTKKVFK